MIARTPELKAALVELSKNWENLAISLEDIQGVLGELRSFRRKSTKLLTTLCRFLSYPIWQNSALSAKATPPSASPGIERRTGHSTDSRFCAGNRP
jgi:hypothetical protein